ncbi:MAG: cupin domain-containing protein [Chloroflexota bacterium]|nr:cupin domain-containing protein [Chloroflexota bacterium]
MMLDIRRFGPGHRRLDPPPNCTRMQTAIILREKEITVVELHFEPGGEMWEHDADEPILFIVISGAGYVRVGGEEAAVSAGQAILWPTGVMHKAWATDEPMTAFAIHWRDA